MGETRHIAEMAEKLSDELFTEFFWKKTGPTDQNWPCEVPEQHGVETHPSDVVFYYDEPYSSVRTYVNCDLKSYAKSTITKPAVVGAVESLAKQVACAECSDEWRTRHIHDNVTPSVAGLLFVYNHDGEYDKDFRKILNAIRTEKLALPRGSKLVVLGPEDIFWLDNVRNELCQMRGTLGPERLPDPQHCRYFYPQLVRKANVCLEKARAATLEMLTSPLIVLDYQKTGADSQRGIVMFYRRRGETTQEFTYLLDYLRHYQVLREGTDVQIKLLDPSPHASTNFQKAVQGYVEDLAGNNENTALAKRVHAIKFKSMGRVKTTFSSIELGMDYE